MKLYEITTDQVDHLASLLNKQAHPGRDDTDITREVSVIVESIDLGVPGEAPGEVTWWAMNVFAPSVGAVGPVRIAAHTPAFIGSDGQGARHAVSILLDERPYPIVPVGGQ